MRDKFHARLARDGFALVPADATRALLESCGSLADWPVFAASWSTLRPDPYLAAVGRRRRRRHGVFSVDGTGILQQEPAQPHYQSREYNPLQGGIVRWFEPLSPETASSASLRAILHCAWRQFASLAPDVRLWRIEVHQFRIEASPDAPGEPTPEGLHRDGVDWVLVLLVARQNVAQGTTTIHAADGTARGTFTLAAPLDAAWIDDRRLLHGVTPVVAVDPQRPAFRDVLVATFRAPGNADAAHGARPAAG